MSLRRICRILAVSALVALLGLSLPVRVEAAGAEAWVKDSGSLWSRAWEWVAWLWVGEGGAVEKEGLGMDPDRRQSEQVPRIDPNGGSTLSPGGYTEEGPGLDPDGKP